MTKEVFFRAYPDAELSLSEAFHQEPILEIIPLKAGRTNHSFIVRMQESGDYVMRVPAAGASELVDRQMEADVYRLLKGMEVADETVFINVQRGHKISRYYADSRALDPHNEEELRLFAEHVRRFHRLKLQMDHFYDYFLHIQKYEDLRGNTPSVFADYDEVKACIFSLKPYLEACRRESCLIHNDLSAENCLMVQQDGQTIPLLIDWEYAAMQDPDSDIAYFCANEDLTETEIDHVIQLYLGTEYSPENVAKVYGYIAVNALVQSNWLEYKRICGQDDPQENRRCFELARHYYQKALQGLKKEIHDHA